MPARAARVDTKRWTPGREILAPRGLRKSARAAPREVLAITDGLEPAAERRLRCTPDRNQAFLVPLAEDTKQAIVKCQIIEVERGDLRDTRAGAVEQLKDRPVSARECVVTVDAIEQLDHAVLVQCLRESSRDRCLGSSSSWIMGGESLVEHEAVEPPDRGAGPSDRRTREPTRTEAVEMAIDVGWRRLCKRDPPFLEGFLVRAKICAVACDGSWRSASFDGQPDEELLDLGPVGGVRHRDDVRPW